MAITLDIVERPKRQHHELYVNGRWVQCRMAVSRDNDGWQHFAYVVRLTNTETGASMDVPYRQGIAHYNDEPEAEDVLACVLMDAAGYQNARDMDDWAADLGFVSPSKALETWNAIAEQTRQLVAVLGDGFSAAIYPTDCDHEEVARRLTTLADETSADTTTTNEGSHSEQ